MTLISAMKRISLTLFLSGCAVLLHFTDEAQAWCSLQFHDLSAVNVYRVVTCHWMHWSTNHLIWDLAVFTILGAVCEWQSRRRYLWTLLFSAVAISLCVMHWLPQLGSYRGLSGIDTALFGLLVGDLLVWRIQERDWTGILFFSVFLIGLVGKISMEMVSHANIFVNDTSFVPVPLAHLVGALIGLAMGAVDLLFIQRGLKTKPGDSGNRYLNSVDAATWLSPPVS